MEASIEVLLTAQGQSIALVRAHPEGGMGNEWCWGCVARITGDHADLYLAPRAPTPSEARALLRAFRKRGVKTLEWERRNTHLDRTTRFEIRE